MRKSFLIGFVMVLGARPLEKISFEKVFPSEFKSANSYLSTNKKVLNSVCKLYGNDPLLATAIVFPELMRYALLSDILETAALELVYVNFGSQAADFSVGRFQMKPSFAESIEREILYNDSLKSKYSVLLLHTMSNVSTQRSVRVKRLKTIHYQLIYLNAFISICEFRFSSYATSNSKDKLRLFSTAYNSGFYRDKQDLERCSNKSLYPYGINYSGTQYAYWKVSEFFAEYASKKCLFASK